MSTTSINIIPQNGNSSVVAIDCGTSTPKLGGTVDISEPTTVYSTTTYSTFAPDTNVTVDGQYNIMSKLF
jgi:hypothetical protein